MIAAFVGKSRIATLRSNMGKVYRRVSKFIDMGE
jgi:hypothetical protein